MTEPTPTKEQIEAATDIYNTVTFDIGLAGASDARDKIAAVLVAREQAARKEALKEAVLEIEEMKTAYECEASSTKVKRNITIHKIRANVAWDVQRKILALIDKGE